MRDSRELATAIREDCITTAHGRYAVHLGGSLSMSDILAVLYAGVLRYDATHPDDPNRDRLVVSKGHCSTAVYAALAEVGFIQRSELPTQYHDGSRLSGHVSHHVEGVDVSTGSLGHGLPIACGMAHANKLNGSPIHTYVIVGDGELQEGTTWEAGMFASAHHLNNLTLIIDFNGLQSLSPTEEIVGNIRAAEHFRLLNWDVIEVDGHDHDLLRETFARPTTGNRPKCVVAHTSKGKGVSFMEGVGKFHSTTISDDQFDAAMSELEASR